VASGDAEREIRNKYEIGKCEEFGAAYFLMNTELDEFATYTPGFTSTALGTGTFGAPCF